MIKFAQKTKKYDQEKKIFFYAQLTHNLTIYIRAIRSDDGIKIEDKLNQIGIINRLFHFTSAHICGLLSDKEWIMSMSEEEAQEDFWNWTNSMTAMEEKLDYWVSDALKKTNKSL